MSEKSTTTTAPEAAAGAVRHEAPPRFTREMAENGRHIVGDTVLREAKPRGRPPKPEGERKEAVKLRLSPEVLAHFRAGGPGWQTRIDEALRAHVARGLAASVGATTVDRGTDMEELMHPIVHVGGGDVDEAMMASLDRSLELIRGAVLKPEVNSIGEWMHKSLTERTAQIVFGDLRVAAAQVPVTIAPREAEARPRRRRRRAQAGEVEE